jgi:ribokinase
MAGSIVILGIFVADTSYQAVRLPAMGETLIGDGFVLGPGGKGSNQAVAAARAGADAHLIARVGRDAFSDMARGIWAEAGVQPHLIYDADAATGAAFVFVARDSGENAIIVCPGAADKMTEADVEAHAPLIAKAAVFATQFEAPMPAVRRGLQIARAAGVRTVLNPAPAMPLPDGLLALCDIVTPNETEAAMLTGLPVRSLPEAEAAARALHAAGAGVVIITLGPQGVLIHDGVRMVHLPAFAAGPVVDTTGAGDAFNGGLATALAQGAEVPEAARFGCATAGIAVTRRGTARAMPTRAEIVALLARG